MIAFSYTVVERNKKKVCMGGMLKIRFDETWLLALLATIATANFWTIVFDLLKILGSTTSHFQFI